MNDTKICSMCETGRKDLNRSNALALLARSRACEDCNHAVSSGLSKFG